MSVCLHGKNWVPTGWIFMTFDISVFFKNPFKKIQDPLKSDKNSG